MKKRKLGIAFLIIAVLSVAIVTVVTLTGSRTPGDTLLSSKDVADARGGAPGITDPLLASIRLPDGLSKQEETHDDTFGRVTVYSNGSGEATERTIWLQTWDENRETVQAYGNAMGWWLDTSAVATVTVGRDKAVLESKTDPGGVDNSLPIQWHRLTWKGGGFGYRLIGRNVTRDQVLALVNSLKSPSK